MKNWGQVPSFFLQCNAQNTTVAVVVDFLYFRLTNTIHTLY